MGRNPAPELSIEVLFGHLEEMERKQMSARQEHNKRGTLNASPNFFSRSSHSQSFPITASQEFCGWSCVGWGGRYFNQR